MPKLSSEDLIQLLENTYLRLRGQNPDRDEHWLLANTWLARYASSEQAKKEGGAWTKFVAYKDTLQFSVLETPKSIKALALFLVYKELGEQAAVPYAIEYADLYEEIETYRNKHVFLHEYRKRNPRTWSENQVEDNTPPMSLYWLFKGIESRDEHPEEAEEVLREMKLGDE